MCVPIPMHTHRDTWTCTGVCPTHPGTQSECLVMVLLMKLVEQPEPQFKTQAGTSILDQQVSDVIHTCLQ